MVYILDFKQIECIPVLKRYIPMVKKYMPGKVLKLDQLAYLTNCSTGKHKLGKEMRFCDSTNNFTFKGMSNN